MTGRELAWRVLAQEVTASVEEERGAGDRATSYVLSPLGARMNRVLVAGTLAPAESIGREESQPFFRARLSDPTGSLSVTAGGFQPRAVAELRAISENTSAMVVGKVRLFRGRDGVGYTSVRAEAIQRLEDAPLGGFFAEAARQTLDRIDLVERLRGEPMLPESTLLEAGYPLVWVRAARDAVSRYPNVDRSTFRQGVATVVDVFSGRGRSPAPSTSAPSPAVTITRTPAPSAPVRPVLSAADRAEEAALLDLLDELMDNSADGYAELKELIARLLRRGVPAERAEAIVNRLEETGVLEEPIVGRLRRA
ncbi:MAG: hypothetical protein WB778_06945 [Thermoplasmata archaeon]